MSRYCYNFREISLTTLLYIKPENRPNIQYAVEKLRLFETLRSYTNYHILGDCKVINDLIGKYNKNNITHLMLELVLCFLISICFSLNSLYLVTPPPYSSCSAAPPLREHPQHAVVAVRGRDHGPGLGVGRAALQQHAHHAGAAHLARVL